MKLISRMKELLLRPPVKVVHVGTVLGDGRPLYQKVAQAQQENEFSRR